VQDVVGMYYRTYVWDVHSVLHRRRDDQPQKRKVRSATRKGVL
jgi:hypothetical protein